MMRSFCCGITPIIQRAGPSTLENTGCTVTTCDWPSRWYSISTGLPPLFFVISWNLICE